MNKIVTISICETIIALCKAREFMEDNLVAKDDKITTLLEPFDQIDCAIRKLVGLLEHENGIEHVTTYEEES